MTISEKIDEYSTERPHYTPSKALCPNPTRTREMIPELDSNPTFGSFCYQKPGGKLDFFGTRTHHYADKYLGLHQLPLQHNIRTLCEHNQSNQIIRDGILVTEDFFYIQQRIKI